jgi:hypothetical protein
MNKFSAIIALGFTLLVAGCEAKPDAKEVLEKSAKVTADFEKKLNEVNRTTKEAVDKFNTSMGTAKAGAAQATKDSTDAPKGVSDTTKPSKP